VQAEGEARVVAFSHEEAATHVKQKGDRSRRNPHCGTRDRWHAARYYRALLDSGRFESRAALAR
jgi:hypothetical protein